MSDPYLDALEQLDQMRDRAFKAEATIARVRSVCESAITDYHRQAATKNGVARAEMARRILRSLEGDSE